jgi:hypothetical protein
MKEKDALTSICVKLSIARLCGGSPAVLTSFPTVVAGVNRRFGLLPAELAVMSKCGLLRMDINAFGHSGP